MTNIRSYHYSTTAQGDPVVVALARPVHHPQLETLPAPLPGDHGWCFAELAGRLVQLEGPGDSTSLTLACTVILEAQQRGEPVAWIAPRSPAAHHAEAFTGASVFYPPDVYETGIDLAALPVVRVPDTAAAFSAADLLLRSGGYGLIVADLGVPPAVTSTVLARLAGLARRHHTALLFLTHPSSAGNQAAARPPIRMDPADAPGSLGSLISLHARSRRQRMGHDRFRCELVVLKDKQRGPVWTHAELCHGAVGLR